MEITQLHDEIFDFLFQKHLEARARGEEFYFRMWQDKDMSMQNPRKNFIFFGNAVWLQLSFWTGFSDNQNYFMPLFINVEERNIEFQIRPTFNNEHTEIATEVAEELSMQKLSDNLYKKEYGNYENTEELIAKIEMFVEGDKKKIDELLRSSMSLSSDYFHESLCFVRKKKISQKLKEYQNGLPLCLNYIYIKNYKAIKSVLIENLPVNSQWIFLTGENGFGKTLLLEAITVGLYKQEEEEGIVLWRELKKSYIETVYRDSSNYRVTFSNYFKFDARSLQEIRKEKVKILLYNQYPSRIPLLAYGSNRIFSDNQATGTILHLFENDMGLPFVQKDWYQKGINDTKQAQFNILKTKMAELGLEIEVDKNKECLLFTQKNIEGEPFDKVRFEELSAAYKSIFLLVGDIIYKFTYTAPSEEYLLEPDENNLKGIVIIDEFELHLHPKMQRFLVEKLTELFPKVQFIVSTHSPIPLLGAPKESIILHVTRTKENGITVERLDDKIDFQTLLPEALLSSPIFDFDNFLRRNGQPFYKFSTENDYNEVVFDKMLEDKLAILAEKGGKTLADILKKKE